jgi:hypothetical protein
VIGSVFDFRVLVHGITAAVLAVMSVRTIAGVMEQAIG